MSSIGPIDQAMLVLRERLRRLAEGKGRETAATSRAAGAGAPDPLVPLRQMVRRGQLGKKDLRRALVRALLGDALGDQLAGSIEFQAIAERVSTMLEESEAGASLLDRAIAELD